MNKDITPTNKDGQRHGYWEFYNTNGQLYFKGNFINGNQDGPWERYNTNGKLEAKQYYI